ncbi:MAG: P1 family peptidase [Hyphomicrobiales bacterium]|nr:P1 family peptidase [Hyphomicrobiales bacterium]
MKTGPRNLITDVAGVSVGNAHDARLASGVTVALFEPGALASVAVTGGAPGGRDLGCLEPDAYVAQVDALVLSGGSAYGLDAPSGAQAFLRERGRGIGFGAAVVPIAPGAILFDLMNGGDKAWGRYPPYRELAYDACQTAAEDFALGSSGAGYGATTADLKGGLGSASAIASAGHRVGALVAVNALGSAVVDGGPHFWAAPFESGTEFGGLGPAAAPRGAIKWKGRAPATTIGMVATDARLTKAEARRMAIAASGGLSKGLRLAHALFDGDTIFAVSTSRSTMLAPEQDLMEICALASDCLARAIARAVFCATALPFAGALPAWRDRFG